MEQNLSWHDFEKVEMRIGTIIEVNDFPEARKPAFQLTIDFGTEIGIKKASAQITKQYLKEDLVGKQIVAVVNFPKKQIGNFMSECFFDANFGSKIYCQLKGRFSRFGKIFGINNSSDSHFHFLGMILKK